MRHRAHRLPGPAARRRDRDLRGTGSPAHVVVAIVELHIPQSRSLKAKRASVKPIVEGLRQRFALAAAEVGFQDKWQRALIGLAAVSETHAHAQEVVAAAERWIWSRPDVEVSRFETEWSSYEGEG